MGGPDNFFYLGEIETSKPLWFSNFSCISSPELFERFAPNSLLKHVKAYSIKHRSFDKY